jgi:hypothetical protein
VDRIPFEPIKKKKKLSSSPQSANPQSPNRETVKKKAVDQKAESLKAEKERAGKKNNTGDSALNNRLKFKPTTALTNRRQNQQVNSQSNKQQNKINTSPIPKVVSDRMIKRSAIFCGIPTGLGFSILIASYIVVSRHLFELPNTPVLLVSLGLTGIGVLGLSYGALSASWDENRLGSWWGADEFQKNFGYLAAALKNQNAIQRAKDQASGKSSEQDLD